MNEFRQFKCSSYTASIRRSSTNAQWKRTKARVAWVREATAAWREAMRQMDDRCSEAVERLSGDEFERFCDAEQSKVDAIRAQLDAVIQRDEWPRGLYFGGI